MPALVASTLRRVLPRSAPDLARGIDAAGEADRPWGHFTRRHAIALMFMREHVPAMRNLERGPWAALQAIAVHWQAGRTDSYPGQERLAILSGYNVRSIYSFTKELERCGLIDLARVNLPDGTVRLHYQPGPALLAAVALFVARYSDERGQLGDTARIGADSREAIRAQHLAKACPPAPPATASGGPPAMVSGELPDPKDLTTSSSSSRVPPEKRRKDEERPELSTEDRRIAVEALATLRQRRFGGKASLFDAKEIAMVAACVSVIEGDRETKLRAQLDAIEHSFGVSRGNPTPSYIWGSVDHFLEHELSGRKARLEREGALVRQARAAEAERSRARERSKLEQEACDPPPETLRFMAELGIRSDFGQGRGGRRRG